jgi:hypothetical protein
MLKNSHYHNKEVSRTRSCCVHPEERAERRCTRLIKFGPLPYPSPRAQRWCGCVLAARLCVCRCARLGGWVRLRAWVGRERDGSVTSSSTTFKWTPWLFWCVPVSRPTHPRNSGIYFNEAGASRRKVNGSWIPISQSLVLELMSTSAPHAANISYAKFPRDLRDGGRFGMPSLTLFSLSLSLSLSLSSAFLFTSLMAWCGVVYFSPDSNP